MKINLRNRKITSFRFDQASFGKVLRKTYDRKQEEFVTFTRIYFTFSIALADAIKIF